MMPRAKRQKVTVAQIAQRAGVSPATVSRVIHQRDDLASPGKFEAVHRAMWELGYELPMEEKPGRKERKVILCNLPDNNLFYDGVVQGAISSANAHGCHLLVNYAPPWTTGRWST